MTGRTLARKVRCATPHAGGACVTCPTDRRAREGWMLWREPPYGCRAHVDGCPAVVVALISRSKSVALGVLWWGTVRTCRNPWVW